MSPRAMPFSSDAGSRPETMPSSECVLVCASGFVRVVAYGGMKSLQSQKAHAAPLHPDTVSLSVLSATSTVFTLCGVFVSIMDACMCDSSQLVAHPSVPSATFSPTSEPSVRQSLRSLRAAEERNR